MKYHSTRGNDNNRSFKQALLGGLAEDKGLYLPEKFPVITTEQWRTISHYSYPELAAFVFRLFVDGELPSEAIRRITTESYCKFQHPLVAPLVPLRDNLSVLELFHGPTFAFKDFALQTLSGFFAHLLKETRQRLLVIGATSGDTGSAAIHACKSTPEITLFMLHPENRTSAIQRLQMTTVDSSNIHNIAIQGSFDDCQKIVKQLLHNESLKTFAANHQASLSAVNSINWGRILAQIVYYLFAALKSGAPQTPVSFAVPSGNFGNIFAAFVAKSMGLPIHKLIIATNHNDILARIQKNGQAQIQSVTPSFSPSMDIQVSSNFERLVYLLSGNDPTYTKEIFQQQESQQLIKLSPKIHQALQQHFDAFTLQDQATIDAISFYHREYQTVFDPHSVIAVKAGEKAILQDPDIPVIALATAHPAKFPDTIKKAIATPFVLPEAMKNLYSLQEKCVTMPNDPSSVFNHIHHVVAHL